MQFSSIWPIDRTLSGATIPSQSGPESGGHEGVLRIPQRFNITGTSPSDRLISFLVGRVLSLCRDGVGVFYSLNQLGKAGHLVHPAKSLPKWPIRHLHSIVIQEQKRVWMRDCSLIWNCWLISPIPSLRVSQGCEQPCSFQSFTLLDGTVTIKC